MKFYNIKNHSEKVSFKKALQQGLGTKQGLFFPENLPNFSLSYIEEMLEQDFITRSCNILSFFINADEINYSHLKKIVKNSFSFPIPIKKISNDINVLELFHGPTLAFKDFGARFMANIFEHINNSNKKITILTATSGDTGAAVAQAFYAIKNIKIVILYPRNKISPIQEKLFCTLGENIQTIAINADFDTCQKLVKQAFCDSTLTKKINLTSANSINISRLLAQICYYFEGFAKLSDKKRNNLIISIPSGNFGNLTAGLLAKSLGLPVKKFIAATNVNDTVPRYLSTGIWKVNKTISSLSNAMDVSKPNNWPRIEELFRRKNWSWHKLLYSDSVSDRITKKSMMHLYKLGYISEPHSAIAYQVLRDSLKKEEHGLFLATAHPSKFKYTVDTTLNIDIKLPEEISNFMSLKIKSHYMDASFEELKKILIKE